MRICCRCQIVIPCIQNICACSVCIVGSQFSSVDCDRESLGCSRCNLICLSESAQRYGRFFHFIVNVVLCVWRLCVDLYGLFSRVLISCVCDFYRNLKNIFFFVVCHMHIAVFKICITHPISERIRNVIMICIFSGIFRLHDIIFITGLIVFISYVNSFLINHVRFCVFWNDPFFISLIFCRNKVHHCRSRKVIIQICINQTSGRCHVSYQDLCHCVDTRNSNVTNPHTRVYIILIIFQEIYLQGIGRVDQNYNFLYIAGFFHLCYICQHFFLIFIQSQIIGLFEIQICSLSTDTRQYHDSSIPIRCYRIFHVICVYIPWNFGCFFSFFCNHSGCLSCIFASRTFTIEVPEFFIDFKSTFLKSGFQCVCRRCINVAGTGSSVNQIYGRVGKAAHFCTFFQRKRIVFIHQKRCSLCFYCFTKFQTILVHFFCCFEIRFIIHGIFVFIFQFPERTAHKCCHGIVKHG